MTRVWLCVCVCVRVCVQMLVSVEKKKIYQHTEFQEMQAAHHAVVREKLVAAAEEIKEVMASVYKVRRSLLASLCPPLARCFG